ncbi:MAG: hypothetical protein LBD59_10450 [Prevotellaceae bacterium]|jgi:hypothetical protein|nr:hypothetical protein [Prevotellaceae bacterium]
MIETVKNKYDKSEAGINLCPKSGLELKITQMIEYQHKLLTQSNKSFFGGRVAFKNIEL